ncbi:hypothetical protein GCM10022281_20590 [Sphingomonas rosea]|uniref:BLUF domain-containing protein n=2 Tax=Sphingomonas rosea TaxID=335605 RepID=A0ABP7UB90_9SPHN
MLGAADEGGTTMKQLIYRSQPFGFDKAMLAGILMSARRNNPRDDITGALICRHDLYLQLIEGPAAAIDALYARIAEDDRHNDVRLLLTEEVEERMFPDWAMLDDEPRSLFWSPEEIAAGALEAAGPRGLRAAFARLQRPGPGRPKPGPSLSLVE